jgi:bifunctional non-homologous end joining protein LigD
VIKRKRNRDRNKQALEISGTRILVSNLDKVLYPTGRFSKGQVIDNYIRAANAILPHVRDRPVTLKRFPDGVRGEFFFEKDAPAFTPEWIQTFPVSRRDPSEPKIRYIVINDLPTLVWLANLANLEVHPFLHRVPHLDQPTSIVFDLDPGEGASILTCARVALLLRNMLSELRLRSFAKVSGSKGLQLYIPMNTEVTYGLT